MHVFPGSEYPHGSRVRESPLYGPWPGAGNSSVLGKSSFVMQALKEVIPKSMASEGLRDWESAGQRDADELAPADALAPGALGKAAAKGFARLRAVKGANRPTWEGLSGQGAWSRENLVKKRSRSDVRMAGGRKR